MSRGRLTPRAATAALFAAHGMAAGSVASRIPWIQNRLSLSPAQLGLAFMIPIAAGAIAGLTLTGWLVHRYGSRTVARCALSTWFLCLPLPAVVPSTAWLAVVTAVCGGAGCAADVALNTQGVALEERLGRPLMSGFHGSWSAGALVGSAIGAVAAYRSIGAPGQLAFVAVLLLLTTLWAGGRLLAGGEQAKSPVALRFGVPRGAARRIGLVGFAAMFAEESASNWSGVYLHQVTAASQGTAAISYSSVIAAMALCRLAGDSGVRRWGAPRAVAVSGAVGVAGGLLVVFGRTPWLVLLGFTLVGAGVAVTVPLCIAAAARSAGQQAIAGVMTLTYGAAFTAPGLFGVMAGLTSLPVAFGLVTVLIAGAGAGGRYLGGQPAAGKVPVDQGTSA